MTDLRGRVAIVTGATGVLGEATTRAFLDAGWKIDRWTFLLASRAFGRFDRYLPSGGMLL